MRHDLRQAAEVMKHRFLFAFAFGMTTVSLVTLGCSSAEPTSSAEGELIGVTMPDFQEPETTNESVALTCVSPGRYLVTRELAVDTKKRNKIWQRRVPEELMTQAQAEQYCRELVLEGLTGFHLPDVHELATLELKPAGLGRRDACIPSIDQQIFPDTPTKEGFWTRTTRDDGTAMYTDFSDGRSHPAPRDMEMHVRCVHDPIERGGPYTAGEVRARIESVNRCSTDDDCAIAGSKCPFGCAVVVNRRAADGIRALLQSYESTCSYMCLPVSKLVCEEKQCKAVYEKLMP